MHEPVIVAFRATIKASHGGDIFGVAPTGKKLVWGAMGLVRVKDGKMAEFWLYFNWPPDVEKQFEMRHTTGRKRILALISERGGGDAPPVITLASALQDRGYTLSVLCDAKTEQTVRSADLEPVVIPDELEQGRHVHPRWLIQLKERGEKLTADTPNPLTIWAEHCAPTVGRIVQQINPVLLISSLFCASLANLLAKRLGVPWCFVNPSFYFGDLGVRAWEEDFIGLAAGWFRYILLPHCDQADLVLHATDREFDPPPYGLPSHHHYIGPLFWEPRQQKDASF